MLACDLILEVRASRSLNRDQVSRLERMAFGAGEPSREQLDMLFMVDRFVIRAPPAWRPLLARAAAALLDAGAEAEKSAAVAARAA
jgi:hypothetical protein